MFHFCIKTSAPCIFLRILKNNTIAPRGWGDTANNREGGITAHAVSVCQADDDDNDDASSSSSSLSSAAQRLLGLAPGSGPLRRYRGTGELLHVQGEGKWIKV